MDKPSSLRSRRGIEQRLSNFYFCQVYICWEFVLNATPLYHVDKKYPYYLIKAIKIAEKNAFTLSYTRKIAKSQIIKGSARFEIIIHIVADSRDFSSI